MVLEVNRNTSNYLFQQRIPNFGFLKIGSKNIMVYISSTISWQFPLQNPGEENVLVGNKFCVREENGTYIAHSERFPKEKIFNTIHFFSQQEVTRMNMRAKLQVIV